MNRYFCKSVLPSRDAPGPQKAIRRRGRSTRILMAQIVQGSRRSRTLRQETRQESSSVQPIERTAVKGELLHHNQQFHYTTERSLLSIEAVRAARGTVGRGFIPGIKRAQELLSIEAVRAVGGTVGSGFIPGIKTAQKPGLQALRYVFRGLGLQIRPFPPPVWSRGPAFKPESMPQGLKPLRGGTPHNRG